MGSGNTVRWVVFGVLSIGLLGVAGCPPATSDPAHEDFAQKRRETEWSVRLETLQAKLDTERQRVVVCQTQADLIRRDLLAERNARQQERIQLDVALRQNDALKKKVDEISSDKREIELLRSDLLRLNELLRAREAELDKVRKELAALKKGK